jgi:hypothetical protein
MIRNILSWILGGLTVLFGLLILLLSLSGGFLIIVAGLLVLPPTKERLKINLLGGLKSIAFIVLFVGGLAMIPTEPSISSPDKTSPSSTTLTSSPVVTISTRPPTSKSPPQYNPAYLALKLTDFDELGWKKNEEKFENKTYSVKFHKAARFDFEYVENRIHVYPDSNSAREAFAKEREKITPVYSAEYLDFGTSGLMYKPSGSQIMIIFVDSHYVVYLINYKEYGYLSERFNKRLAEKVDKRI